jgi:hypothetical protein
MPAPIRKTPRQAAYQDLCAIIAQLAGRSRRAQRALLEAELVRALERAHDFQGRCAALASLVRGQQDRLAYAAAQVTAVKAEARQRIQSLRQEVFAVIERCKSFENACRELLAVTEAAVAVAPPALVVRPAATPASPATSESPPEPREHHEPPEDVDEEAITERCPAPSGASEEGTR